MKLKNIFNTWRNVFGNWKYVMLTAFIAIAFYSFNVLISGWQNIKSVFLNFGFLKTADFFFASWLGFNSTMIFSSFLSLIIISVLFGVFISLILYKSRLNILGNKKVGLFGGVGVFLGVLAPGCVACGVGLASILGLGAGFLAFLPYEGLELSILSIGILSFAVLNVSNNMYQCDVPLRKTKNKELKGGIK